MSRIHEALKKAERERSGGQAPGTVIPEPVSAAAEPSWNEQSPLAASPEEAGAPSSSSAVMPGYFRFEDLLEQCAHPRWQVDPNMNVFSAGSGSRGAEQFRTLRSRLYQLRANQPLRTLLVTSAVPAEGKTFVASNLAQAIVRQPDRRVLLIDADLRSPRLHLPFGAPSSPGLSDYLRGDVDETTVIQCGGDSNLCLMVGGSEVTNPSELLSNGRFSTLLNRVGQLFDWVILDSPPCLPVADSSILADLCDAVLLVVRAGVTPSEIAQRGLQELQNRTVVGVVLNGVEESHIYGSSYYYGDYGYSRPPNSETTSVTETSLGGA